jgi:hypothetical protein
MAPWFGAIAAALAGEGPVGEPADKASDDAVLEVTSTGFAEVRASGQVGVDGVPWQLVERARPTVDLRIGPRFALSSTLEVAFPQGRDAATEARRALLDSPVGPLLLGVCDWPEPSRAIRLDETVFLDRLYVDLYLRDVDLRIGRQALQWGSGQLVNPTDPLPQVLFTEPWRPRAGVNAARATVPLGGMSQLQGVVSVDDRFRYLRAAGRGTVSVGGTDLSVVAAYRGDDDSGIVGLDVRGAYAVGFWFEGALHLGRGGWRAGIYEEFSVGLDWMRPVGQGSVGLSAQYYRNGGGQREVDLASRLASGALVGGDDGPDCPSDLPFAIGSTAPASPFRPALQGRDYALLSLRGAPVPEFSVQAAWLQNLGDGSGLIVPALSMRPTGWLDLSFTGQIPLRLWGDGGELSPGDTAIDVPLLPGMPPLQVELGGLIPSATLTGWVRVSW